MNKLPTSIMITSMPIEIKRVPFELPELYARFFKFRNEILINKEIADDKIIASSILHEVIHAIESRNTGIPPLQEDQVDHIANYLYAFIKDNPKFMEWIKNV